MRKISKIQKLKIQKEEMRSFFKKLFFLGFFLGFSMVPLSFVTATSIFEDKEEEEQVFLIEDSEREFIDGQEEAKTNENKSRKKNTENTEKDESFVENNSEEDTEDVWQNQKEEIIRNIRTEIYLNGFDIEILLEEEIKSLESIEEKIVFIQAVKSVYEKIDTYYDSDHIIFRQDFEELRNDIIRKIEKFSQIENMKMDKDFEQDLEILKTVQSQKLFLQELEEFFNKHIKDYSLRSVPKNSIRDAEVE